MTDAALPKVRNVRPSVGDIAYLSHYMREDEREQWLALSGLPAYDADDAARAIIGTMGPFAFCLIGRDDRPIVAGGFNEIRPGVFQTWMIGTPAGWEGYWREITRHSKRIMDRMLAEGRAHRFQTHALATRRAACAWYERLGMSSEGIRRRYFSNGADAIEYARTAP